MRPYQIAACEKIILKINSAHHNKLYGKTGAGGYIWHSTGSGKTLTSFKTALLASKFDFIYKVLFVVDRKDLDYQICKEYDKFQKDAANSMLNTKALKQALEDKHSKILITTIQKLSNFIKKYENSKVFNEEIVFIFDECHRSQFGAMHEAIIKKFKKYYLFGFTGTPILTKMFEEDTTLSKTYGVDKTSGNLMLKTTDSVFGDRLHSYAILNAIRDKNVLPFKVSYFSTMHHKDSKRQKVAQINTEEALKSDERISKIVKYILENFDTHTKRKNAIKIANKRKQGFNAIFATSSVDFAKKYYEEFQRQNKALQEPLKIGLIYSYEANEDLDDEFFPSDFEEYQDANSQAQNTTAKDFLSEVLKDYNAYFKSHFELKNFDLYYKDISQKTKDKELDLLIVVNMFLTGFDSKTINTLYVDKNLKYHSLLQAFSRTNRILNESKVYGNIICFRDLRENVTKSLEMFSTDEKEIYKTVLFKDFEYYFSLYTKKIKELKENFALKNLSNLGEKKQKEFIKLFGEILRLDNILSVFDEFKDAQNPLSLGLKQDYQSFYLEFYYKFKENEEKEDIREDLNFELELIDQNDINVDFILFLLEKYYKEHKEEIKISITKSLLASKVLRDKKELIEEFLARMDKTSEKFSFRDLFKSYIQEKKDKELSEIIAAYKLDSIKTKEYLQNAFELSFFQDKGEKIQSLLPKISIKEFANKELLSKREEARQKLKTFFEKFKLFLKGLENE